MAEQLILEWAPRPPPAFDNFVAGGNAEVLAHLRALSRATLGEPSVMIWGPPGTGKTHLLAATIGTAAASGRMALIVPIDEQALPAVTAGALYAVDDVDRLSASAQGRLFTLYNACRDAGAQLLLAARLPPAQAPLRDDLRTRAGWGLVLELRSLTDAEKPDALAAFAQSQGFHLPREVIDFLLARRRRDMGALLATLRALDRYSLSTQRQVTIPLVKELLQPELPLDNSTDRR